MSNVAICHISSVALNINVNSKGLDKWSGRVKKWFIFSQINNLSQNILRLIYEIE